MGRKRLFRSHSEMHLDAGRKSRVCLASLSGATIAPLAAGRIRDRGTGHDPFRWFPIARPQKVAAARHTLR
jgi:hypothetical protein